MTDDRERGLYSKFKVTRTDGRSEDGEKHHGCSYFVIDLNHDKHAVAALLAYAGSCVIEYPQLADDLINTAVKIQSHLEAGIHPSCFEE